jgi:hypothetical protein
MVLGIAIYEQGLVAFSRRAALINARAFCHSVACLGILGFRWNGANVERQSRAGKDAVQEAAARWPQLPGETRSKLISSVQFYTDSYC